MNKSLRPLFASLAFLFAAASVGAAEKDTNCYRDVCVGDHALNVSREYREVTVVAIESAGKFVIRFEDNGGIGGNWDREDLALMQGCAGDLCVGFPAFNISREYRSVSIRAIQFDNRFVLRFNDNGGVGGNWDRSDLAVAWGCVRDLCVNDTVYNRSNGRQATIAAIQTNAQGVQDRMVLNYAGSLGGNWEFSDLVLLQRGPPAYPPAPPTPYCPPGTHYDSRLGRCVSNTPPPPPYCPPGTHYDARLGRCVANQPPPPPSHNWQCTIHKPGRIFTGRGPTRSAATQAVLHSCARASGGYACRASEAACRVY